MDRQVRLAKRRNATVRLLVLVPSTNDSSLGIILGYIRSRRCLCHHFFVFTALRTGGAAKNCMLFTSASISHHDKDRPLLPWSISLVEPSRSIRSEPRPDFLSPGPPAAIEGKVMRQWQNAAQQFVELLHRPARMGSFPFRNDEW
jgi:hypothetical protein